MIHAWPPILLGAEEMHCVCWLAADPGFCNDALPNGRMHQHRRVCDIDDWNGADHHGDRCGEPGREQPGRGSSAQEKPNVPGLPGYKGQGAAVGSPVKIPKITVSIRGIWTGSVDRS